VDVGVVQIVVDVGVVMDVMGVVEGVVDFVNIEDIEVNIDVDAVVSSVACAGVGDVGVVSVVAVFGTVTVGVDVVA
jgi:hypothetical protein